MTRALLTDLLACACNTVVSTVRLRAPRHGTASRTRLPTTTRHSRSGLSISRVHVASSRCACGAGRQTTTRGHVAFRMALAGSRGDEDLRSIPVVCKQRPILRSGCCCAGATRRTPVSIPGGCRRRRSGGGRGRCRWQTTQGAMERTHSSLHTHSRETASAERSQGAFGRCGTSA